MQPKAATSNATVSLSKKLNGTGPFEPGAPLRYTLSYTCSSLTDPCVNATLVDTLPDNLKFVSNTSTSHPSKITVDGNLLTVTFLQNVGGGRIGLAPGTTGDFDVVVTFADDVKDGETANNCAQMTADGLTPADSCAEATAVVHKSYGVSLVKAYGNPQTGETATSGVQGTDPTSTLNLAATLGGSEPATSVTVQDPTRGTNPFDSFDLVNFAGPLSLPAGIQATISMKSTGGYAEVGTFGNGQSADLPGAAGINATDVTGIKIVYTRTDGSAIAPGTKLGIAAKVALREKLRSSPTTAVPTGTVPNTATATADYPDAPDASATDNADYTVVGRSAGTGGSKTISPGSVQQGSTADITVKLTGTNTSNVAANSMVITDPTNGTTPFDTFTFSKFTALALPGGVSAKVEVLVDGAWTTIGTGLGNGSVPSLGSVPAEQVQGVRFSYSGSIARGTTISNAFVTKLKPSATAFDSKKINCLTVNLNTAFSDTSATAGPICANFAVSAISTKVQSNKSFTPVGATAQTGAKTTVALTGTNASNVPVDNFMLTEPGIGSGPVFDSLDFVGFGALAAPAGTQWKVEVLTGTTWTTAATGLTNTDIPTLPAGVTADQVRGVQYTLTAGQLPSNASIKSSIKLQLRDVSRATGASIDSGKVNNCLTASSTGAPDATKCASFTVSPINPGTGVGSSKNIVAGSVIAGTGATTDVDLKIKNDSNTTVNSFVVVDDRAGSGTATNPFWDAFTFNGFGRVNRPATTTSLKVEYWNGAAWQLIGSYPGSGAATPTLPAGVTNADVHGVRYTWTGSYPPGTQATARFSAKLADATAAGKYQNCAEMSYDGDLIDPVNAKPCDTITVVPRTYTVTQNKTFDPATGTIGLDDPASTTATLTVKNTSNVGLERIVVTDPAAGSNPFDRLDLTGFDTIAVPGNVRVKIEADDGPADGTTGFELVADSLGSGATVTVPGTIDLPNVTAVRVTYTSTAGTTIAAGASMSLGLKLALRDTVRGTDTQVTAGPIENCFATAATATGNQVTVAGDPCATFAAEAQSPGVSDGKTWNPASGVREALPSSTITIKGRNSGNVPVDSLTLQDPATVTLPVAVDTNAFDAFDVTGFSQLVFPAGADRVQLDVLTADGSWHTGIPAATLPAPDALPDGVAIGYVVGVRATFTNSAGTRLPVVADSGRTGNVGIDVTLRKTLRSTGKQIDVPAGGSYVVRNTSTANVAVDGTSTTAPGANANYTVTGGSVKAVPDKSMNPVGINAFNPGDAVIYRLQIKNTGNRNMVSPVLLDKFPETLVYDATQPFPEGQFEFVSNGSTLTGPVTADTTTAGQVKFTFGANNYLAPGQTAFLDVVLKVAPGIPAGTQIRNEYGITWDTAVNGPVGCSTTGTGDFDGTDTVYCTDDEVITIKQSRGLSSLKEIKGDDDTAPTNVIVPGADATCPNDGGYTYYPCVAHTQAGNVFDYRLGVTNIGNVAMNRALLIDVLPYVGDTGVLLTHSPRLSQWQPTLQGNVEVTGTPEGAIATVYYSTSRTPSTAALTGAPWSDDWSTTSFGADTAAIAVDVHAADGTPIAPGARFQLHWKMRTPDNAPTQGAIAWNSFAYTGEPTDSNGRLLSPAEPRKVGIVLDNPTVMVQKTTAPEGADGTFEFTLTQLEPAGDPVSKSVTTSDGTGTSSEWASLIPDGSYRLTETDAPAYLAGQFVCVNTADHDALVTTTGVAGGVEFVAAAGAAISCSITNAKRPTVTLHKFTEGGDGTFDFALTPVDADGTPTGEPLPATVTTVDGTADFSWGLAHLTPGGSYTLTEEVRDEWVSTFVSCVDKAAINPGDFPASVLPAPEVGAVFTTPAGAQIDCVFSNTNRPIIVVDKTTLGTTTGDFDFVLEGTGGSRKTVSVNDSTGTATWGPNDLEPGDYTLSEDTTELTDGWASEWTGCLTDPGTGATGVPAPIGAALADGRTGATLHLEPGEVVHCSFTNSKRPTVTVAKTAVGGDSTFEFTLTGDGGSAADITTVDGKGSHTWGPANLVPGNEYTLAETVQDGWSSEFGECNIDVTSHTDRSVTFVATAGTDITCNFTNTKREDPPTTPPTTTPPSGLVPTTPSTDPGPTSNPAPSTTQPKTADPTSSANPVPPVAGMPAAPDVAPGGLAETGVRIAGIGLAALLLLGAGAFLLLLARRRTDGRHSG